MSESRNYRGMISKHGTEDISRGKLTGTTDTDYFYFLCPKCDGGGSEVMRILDVGSADDFKDLGDEFHPAIKQPFHFAFELYCDKCKTHSVVKLTNVNGLLGGTIVGNTSAIKHRVIGPTEEL